MDAATDFDRYMEHLCEALGHADRRAGLRGYCAGLMLLLRKSVDQMAAVVDVEHVCARLKRCITSSLKRIGMISCCFAVWRNE